MSSFESVAATVFAVLLLVACSAPPTPSQATSRAVKRNCEAQADTSAEEVRRQSATLGLQDAEIESRTAKAREQAFAKCMREFALP